jgi:E3 ubiquitin-protein ligase TRIP12
MENVVPLHGYHSKSTEYLDLLRFMGELDHEERRKFLKFVTGSPRLPNGGFASLEPRLTVVHKKPINASENPDDILPSVMTCQNYIKLPSYSSYEKLKIKF